MKYIHLLVFGIILLFTNCSSSKEPNSFLGVKFGTEYAKVKNYMLSKGYSIYREEASQRTISFTGTYKGFKTEMILLEMDENYKFREGWLNIKENREKFLSFMKEKLTNQYKHTPDHYQNEKGEIWKWDFTSHTFILGSGNNIAYYRVIKKDN